MRFTVRCVKLHGLETDTENVELELLNAIETAEILGYRPTSLRIPSRYALALSRMDCGEAYRMIVAGTAQFAGLPLAIGDELEDAIELTAEPGRESAPAGTPSSTSQTA